MAAVESDPRPFVGHDDLDEEANDPNDVLIPPETTVRYDRNEDFILIQMRMPRNIRQDAASLEEMRDHANVRWVHCPDALLPLIPHVEGMDPNRCVFRIPPNNTLATWHRPDWLRRHRMREGDILVSPSPEFCPLDHIGLAELFLQTPAPRHYWVARPKNRLGNNERENLESGTYEEILVAPKVGYLRRVNDH
jgi:hypothetical protein